MPTAAFTAMGLATSLGHDATTVAAAARAGLVRPALLPVWVDHAEEHTLGMILDGGYWAGLTLYPMTKMSCKRAVDILERFDASRIMVNSSADWGPSTPFTLFDCIDEFKARGHSEQEALEVFHNNPARYLSQSGKFPIKPVRLQHG